MRSVLPYIGYLFIRGLHAIIRTRHVRPENIESTPHYVLSFWHAHLLLMLHCRFRKPIAVMTSRSKDGDVIARIFNFYGVRCARGSSSRGAREAVRELVRAGREGYNLVFTPDGPVGPPRVAKLGVVMAAKVTGYPIVPIAFAAKKKSTCGRGTGWSCRCRSLARSISTASRSSCRVMATTRSGARRSRQP